MAYFKIADNLKIFSARAGDVLLMLCRCRLTSLVIFGVGLNQSLYFSNTCLRQGANMKARMGSKKVLKGVRIHASI